MNPTDIALSGPLLLAILVSLAAGAVSFASPCVVPLVPGYLAFLAGLVGAQRPPTPGDTGPDLPADAADRAVDGATVATVEELDEAHPITGRRTEPVAVRPDQQHPRDRSAECGSGLSAASGDGRGLVAAR